MFELYNLFEKLLNLSIEKFHEILVIEYFEKAAVIFAIKIPKINCQGCHFLEPKILWRMISFTDIF